MNLNVLPNPTMVLITHEHEDHFNLPSLNALSRDVPVLLPGRSSVAAQAALKAMGFSYTIVRPGDQCQSADLRVTFFSPNHAAGNNLDEWDVLPFLVEEHRGGAFFTPVDVGSTATIESYLESIDQPNIAIALHGTFHFIPRSRIRSCLNSPKTPNSQELIHAESNAFNSIVLKPGDNIEFSAEQVLSTSNQTSFLSLAPKETWPRPESFFVVSLQPDFGPRSGQRAISKSELLEVELCLNEIASFIYGGPLFRMLYSIYERNDSRGNCVPVGVMLRRDRGRYSCYGYDTSGCQFVPISRSRAEAALAGIECWASDFMMVCRGDIEPRVLTLGHARSWSHEDGLPNLFHTVIWPFFHPLRRPRQCEHGYMECLNRLREANLHHEHQAAKGVSVVAED